MADLAVASDGLGAASRGGLHPLRDLGAAFAAEGERRALWLPVCFGTGIALYFALTVEPPLWLALAGAAIAAGLAVAVRRHPAAREAAVALAVVASGFALAVETRWQRDAPMLQRRLGPVAITGRVVDIDSLDRGWRVVIAPDPLPGLADREQPRRVRVHVPGNSDPLAPGDRLAVKAMLYPVPGQVIPGGHDLQREAYFAQIGGVGYSYGAARHILTAEGAGSADAPERGFGWREALLRLRAEMTRRITAALPGSAGGVASALITGKRGAVAEPVKQAFRDSGLSHLLAIAGLHLGLVAGFVFFAVRGGLALVPSVALRYPIKKIAAAATLGVLFCYLLISGAAIPTQRAFVMNGIVFAGILIDRLRISMRICAIAAFIVLLLDPASLVGPSFQMSFSAVVALIAVYETYGARLGHWLRGGSVGRKALGYCGGIAITTVVVTIGTDPFSIYHFHRVAFYSPLANVVAVPLSAMWTLPCGVFACLLMPFGLERLALVPMGWGIEATIWVAEHVAALPGNVWTMPRFPVWGVTVTALGGLWLCLWQGRWRRWGAVGILAGMSSLALSRPPDIVIADFGRLLAARMAAGAYWVAAGEEQRINRGALAEDTGSGLEPWPGDGAAEDAAGLACANQRCFYTARGRRVAIVTGEAGLPVLCGTVDAIVSQVPAGFRCRSTIPVVDRIDVWRQGAVALWLDPDGVRLEAVNDSRGDRPWVPHPISARERARRLTAGE
ncbi:MAG: ComEC/Rec2 family competence protein [Alphaproteobacteria bacterium]|nr:ComEC/Rec2 family competence protein [Alphaproteobacteria bacterium]